ncbi:MAG: HAMP domain-containing protein [Flavobacteriales bacterium]|nr:HAMP domain-containing protein [Flavobacteriales bacterium]
MSIRNRLAFQFGLLASLVLGVASVAIFLLSAQHRKDEFSERMQAQGERAAKLLLQVDEVDEPLLRIIDSSSPLTLPEERVMIYDHNDSLIYNSAKDTLGGLHSGAFLNSVRANEKVHAQAEDIETFAFMFMDRHLRFVVVVSASDIFGRSKLRNLAQVLLLVVALGIGIFFLLGRVYAERALRPIKKLVSQISGISVSNLESRVSEGDGKDEIAQLAVSFNGMLAKLEAAFSAQRNFIGNASHELRTPLTAISGQLDVILLKERGPEEYRAALESVHSDIQRLNRLANRLLLLAQTGTDAPEAGFHPVRLDEVLWEAREAVLRSRPGSRIEVRLDEGIEDIEALTVRGSNPLLHSLFINLMENGCKYSEDSHVSVDVNIRGSHAELQFSDKGIGISNEDLVHIFEPFFRSSSTRGSDGHGIGLSLVKRITGLHRGTVAVWSQLGKGTVFTVRLPLLALEG